jgi:hypothetical protein
MRRAAPNAPLTRLFHVATDRIAPVANIATTIVRAGAIGYRVAIH